MVEDHLEFFYSPNRLNVALTRARVKCVVFANERFVAVHTKDGGEIKVSLPRRYARITDLLADKVVAENADSFTCTFSSPDTRLFDLSEND